MRLPERFERARTEEEVLAVLGTLAHEARFDSITVRVRTGDASREYAAFNGVDYQDMDKRDITLSALVLSAGTEEVLVEFGWRSEMGDVPPQMDILLQLVVDELGRALVRCESKLMASPTNPPADAVASTAAVATGLS
jgi:hypothetical protein